MSIICKSAVIKTPLFKVFGKDNIITEYGIFSDNIINNNGHILFKKDMLLEDIEHHDEDYMLYLLSKYNSEWKSITVECRDGAIGLITYRLEGVAMWEISESNIVTSRCARCELMPNCKTVKTYLSENYLEDVVSLNRKYKILEKQLNFVKSMLKVRLLDGEEIEGVRLTKYDSRGKEVIKLNIEP